MSKSMKDCVSIQDHGCVVGNSAFEHTTRTQRERDDTLFFVLVGQGDREEDIRRLGLPIGDPWIVCSTSLDSRILAMMPTMGLRIPVK